MMNQNGKRKDTEKYKIKKNEDDEQTTLCGFSDWLMLLIVQIDMNKKLQSERKKRQDERQNEFGEREMRVGRIFRLFSSEREKNNIGIRNL